MDYTVEIYSKAYLETEEADSWANATVSRDLWQELFREHSTNRRLFVSLTNEEKTIICAVGNPHLSGSTDSYKMYLPYQVLDKIGCVGEGETRQVTVFTEEAFPPVEKIHVRFVDSAAYNSDIKEELELAFGKLGVIQKDSQYQIPIHALGNFPVDIYVSSLEPADMVFCHGDEVEIEFEEPIDQITPPPESSPQQRTPTPIPLDVPSLMVPPEEETQPQGRVLGSDPNTAPPLWRQQLGPPRRR